MCIRDRQLENVIPVVVEEFKAALQEAKEILEISPEEPIKEVAAAVGYSDAYHFSKLFKKHYGISPLYYKKESFS